MLRNRLNTPLLIMLVGFTSGIAHARPVSYADSWTIMARNDADQNSMHAHYTFDRKHSIGARIRYDREADAVFTGLQLNRLMKRWNAPDSQANFYAKAALGMVTDQANGSLSRDNDTGYMLALAADWETRRYFISGEAEHWDQGRFGDQSAYHVRVGIAPYVANTGALHTWLMLEAHEKTKDEDAAGATAILRLFKGPGLLELGIDTEGKPLLNYIHRF